MLNLEAERGSELELRDYLQVLRRRKLAILLPTVLIAALALALALIQTPVYAASAKILLQPTGQTLFQQDAGLLNSAALVNTEIEVLRSPPVQEAVREELGFVPGIGADGVAETSVIAITAKSSKPETAARIANVYAEAYVEYRRQRAVDNLLAAGEQIQEKVSDLQAQIDALDRQVNEAPPAARDGVRQDVTAQRAALVQQQQAFKERIAQAQVDSSLATGQAQIVQPATPASSPVSPKPMRNVILGLLVGLVVGVALAFLLDHLDDSIKTKEEFNRAAGDLPVVGMIPTLAAWKAKRDPRVISIEDPRSPVAEAYRTACTALQFLTLDRPLRLLQITSPGVEEGKSTTIANLGIALVNRGQRVVIVCCDLRRPRIHSFFGLDNSVGLTSVLMGTSPLSSALQPVPGQDKLSVLASGPLPPNPAELLSSSRATDVFQALRGYADIVLLDSPPVLPVSDAMILASKVDGLLLASYIGETTTKEVVRAVELLRQVDAPLVGAILNGMQGGGSSYYYYYHHRDADSRKSKKAARRNGNGSVDAPLKAKKG